MHLRATSASTKEIDSAALSDHVDSPLPGFRTSHGFDNYVRAALCRRDRPHRLHWILHLYDLNYIVSTLPLGCRYLRITLYHGNHVASDGMRHLHEHQSNRAASDDCDGVADFNPGFVQTAQHTGQGLNHRRILIVDEIGDDEHVLFNNAPGDTDVFGVGAIVEQQIFAKVLLVLGAIKTTAAGR